MAECFPKLLKANEGKGENPKAIPGPDGLATSYDSTTPGIALFGVLFVLTRVDPIQRPASWNSTKTDLLSNFLGGSPPKKWLLGKG